MMNVRIGITTSFEHDEHRLNVAYTRAVEQAGGLPLMVPVLETDAAVHAFTQLLDGLVISGGPAIVEGLVGSLPDDLDETDSARIKSDERVLASFLTARKPVLGICYGMQLLNARAGGSIFADVEHQRVGALAHSPGRGADAHSVSIEPGTHLHRLLGTDELSVNTRHIQAVASVARAFRVSATAPDGVVEAIESPDGLVLGVQFHPERMGTVMQPLFRHLIERARQQKQRQRTLA